MQQHAAGTGRRQRQRRRAAVGELPLLLLARRYNHLGAGVHQDNAGKRFARSLGNAAHLLEVGRIEFLDRRHHRLGAAFELAPVDAALQERLRIHLDAATQAVGGCPAMGAAALARATGELDQGKRGVGGHGCPSKA